MAHPVDDRLFRQNVEPPLRIAIGMVGDEEIFGVISSTETVASASSDSAVKVAR